MSSPKKLLLLLIVCVSLDASAQQTYSARAFQLQLEALGPAGLFSFNMDSRFSKGDKGLGFRLGIGGTPLGLLGHSCNTGTQLSLPAGINYLVGDEQHLFEAGGGAVLTMIGSTKRACEVYQKPGFFSDETSSYFFLSAGYRYQPVKKRGISYRLFLSPLFQQGHATKFWGGVSIGRRF